MTIKTVETALKRAYQLGQIYWQQADSEYASQNKKADTTEQNFRSLVIETLASIEQEAAVEPAKPAPVECEPVAWGFPNTAISGKGHALMLVRLEVPSDDQYGGALWLPLYLNPLDAETCALVLELCELAENHEQLSPVVWAVRFKSKAIKLKKLLGAE